MQFEEVSPQKLLAFLKKRSEELENEVNVLRTEFYQAVEAGNDAFAASRLTAMVQRNDEYASVYTEYLTGQEYIVALQQITEQDRDRPVN